MPHMVLIWVVAAAIAGAIAWRCATRLDRRSPLHDHSPHGVPDEDRVWKIALLALIGAVAATALFQIAVLDRLRVMGDGASGTRSVGYLAVR